MALAMAPRTIPHGSSKDRPHKITPQRRVPTVVRPLRSGAAATRNAVHGAGDATRLQSTPLRRCRAPPLRAAAAPNAGAGATAATAVDARPVVVVTGASSGIGKATAELLASRGWRVFAGVRSAAAADELRGLGAAGAIEPITIDVRDAAGVRAAAAEVAAAVGPAGLQGLVNNAGLGIFLPVEAFTEEALSLVYDVNVTGVLRATQAFLPLLRAGARRGRVVNMSSIAGSVSFPMFAAYSGSKHALEAMSDALRFELMPQNIPVSLIKPGPVVTDIWRRARDGSESRYALGPKEAALYSDLYGRTQRLTRDAERDGIAATDVAAVVLRALEDASPRHRYFAGSAGGLHALRRLLPDRIFHALLAKYYGL